MKQYTNEIIPNINLKRNITNNITEVMSNKGFVRERHKSIKKILDSGQVLYKPFQETLLSDH